MQFIVSYRKAGDPANLVLIEAQTLPLAERDASARVASGEFDEAVLFVASRTLKGRRIVETFDERDRPIPTYHQDDPA